MVKIILILILTSLFLNGPLALAARPVEYIFDVDDTLISADVRRLPQDTISAWKEKGFVVEPVKGKLYRLAHGSAETLASLATVGFFSAHGNEVRSRQVVRHFGPRYARSTLLTYANVLRLEPMSKSESSLLQPSFSVFEGAKKKDLSQSANFKSHDVILIDNDPSHIVRGQEKNFIWVRNKTLDSEFARIRGLIDFAEELSARNNISLPDALWKLQWMVLPDGQLAYREDVCESPEVYRRGFMILNQMNPLFSIPANYLEPLRAHHESLPHQGTIFKGSLETIPQPATFTGWRSKLSSFLGAIFGLTEPELDVKPVSHISQMIYTVAVGQEFQTDSGSEFQVINLQQDDAHIRRFLIRNKKDGSVSTLLVPSTHEPQSKEELARQLEFLNILSGEKIAVPEVQESAEDYIVTSWTGPITAKRWLDHMKGQNLKGDIKYVALMAFLNDTAAKGVYLSALAPEDLRWTGRQWVVINKSGTLRTDLTTKEILDRYQDRILKRWWLNIDTGECNDILQ